MYAFVMFGIFRTIPWWITGRSATMCDSPEFRAFDRADGWRRVCLGDGMLRNVCVVLALAAASGCSSSSASDSGANQNARAGQINGSDVWKDDVTLTGAVIVGKGADVEIAPGARIT